MTTVFKDSTKNEIVPPSRMVLWVYYHRVFIHKFWVFFYLLKICFALVKRGIKHDNSKLFLREEFEAYLKWSNALNGAEYGSAQYKEVMRRFSGDIHYKLNTHHPEHYGGDVKKMSVLDVVEMLADWMAASTRRKGGAGVFRSIEINADFHGMESTLKSALERDAKEAFF